MASLFSEHPVCTADRRKLLAFERELEEEIGLHPDIVGRIVVAAFDNFFPQGCKRPVAAASNVIAMFDIADNSNAIQRRC